jgi:hypothetical protein
MNGQACGAQLPLEAKACPNCGTLTPAYYAGSGASPHDPTIQAALGSSPYAVNALPPSTQYGSNPSDIPLQNPYNINTYEAPVPPPSQRPGKRIGIFVGLVVLVLLLISSSVFAWLKYSSANKVVVTTASTTAAAQHFTAKGPLQF